MENNKESLVEVGKGYIDNYHPSLFINEGIHRVREYSILYNPKSNKFSVDMTLETDFFNNKNKKPANYLKKLIVLDGLGYVNLGDQQQSKTFIQNIKAKLASIKKNTPTI